MPLYNPASSSGTSASDAIWNPAQQGYLAANYDPQLAASSVALANGFLHMTKMYLTSATPVASLVIDVSGAGATLTAGQCFGFVFSSAGTLLGKTADLSAVLNSTGTKTLALIAEPAQSLPSGGAGIWVHFGVLTNGTTAPSLRAISANAPLMNVNLATAAGRAIRSSASGNTSVPSTRPAVVDDLTRPFWAAAL